MQYKGWIGLAAAVFVLLLVGVLFWPKQESAQLTEVKQLQTEMQQKMFAPAADQKAVSPEERRAHFEQMRQKMDALPEAERKQAAQAMHEGFARQMQEKISKFFALSPEEQTAALDKEIDEQEARRKEGGGMPFGPPPGGPPPFAPPPGGSANGAGNQAGVTAGGNGAAPSRSGPTGNRPFGPGNWQNMSSEQRKQMQRQMLDSTTPEFRAQMSEYIKKVDSRRQARGLPTFRPGA